MKNYNIDNPESRPQDQKRLQQLWTDQRAILDQGELPRPTKKSEKFMRFISKQNYALDQQKYGGGVMLQYNVAKKAMDQHEE